MKCRKLSFSIPVDLFGHFCQVYRGRAYSLQLLYLEKANYIQPDSETVNKCSIHDNKNNHSYFFIQNTYQTNHVIPSIIYAPTGKQTYFSQLYDTTTVEEEADAFRKFKQRQWMCPRIENETPQGLGLLFKVERENDTTKWEFDIKEFLVLGKNSQSI